MGWVLLLAVMAVCCAPARESSGGRGDEAGRAVVGLLSSATPPVPGAPVVALLSSLHVDGGRGRLYAAAQVNGEPRLAVLDAGDGRLLAAWDGPGQLALDAVRGRLVVDRGAAGIALLDAATGETQGIIELPPQDRPAAPVVNTRTGLIYAFRGTALHVLDPAIQSAVRVLPLGVGRFVCDAPSGDAPVERAAYDPGADRLYLAFITHTCIPWAMMTLVAYDGTTLAEIGRTEVDINTQFIPADGALVGLSVSRLGPTLAWAWDGETRRYERNGDFQGTPLGMAADPERELVYEGVGTTIRAVDPRDGTIVGAIDNPIEGEARPAGYNPVTDTLYLVTTTGRLFLWSAANLFGGAAQPAAAVSALPMGVVQTVALSPNWAADSTMAAIVGGDGCAPGEGRLYVLIDPAAGWFPGLAGSGDSCASVSVVAFSPAYRDDSLLFAATATGGDSPPTVLRSLDTGRSWTAAETPFPEGTEFVALLPSPDYAADQTLYALTSAGLLYRSRDGGRGWLLLDQRLDRVAMAGGNGTPSPLFGSLGGRMLRSTDGGTRWAEVGATPDGGPLNLLAAAVYSEEETVLFALTAAGRFARSLDGGATWQPVMETSSGAGQLIIAGTMPDGLRPVFLLHERTITASYDGMASVWAATATDEAGRYQPTAIAAPPDFAAAPYLFVGTADGQIIRVRADARP